MKNYKQKPMTATEFIRGEEQKYIFQLKECAEAFEEQGHSVTIGNFSTFADFLLYFGNHYAPILRKVQKGQPLSKDDSRLLTFFADDMLMTFAED